MSESKSSHVHPHGNDGCQSVLSHWNQNSKPQNWETFTNKCLVKYWKQFKYLRVKPVEITGLQKEAEQEGSIYDVQGYAQRDTQYSQDVPKEHTNMVRHQYKMGKGRSLSVI